MTVTNHDDWLGEIYPAMLNELNCSVQAYRPTFKMKSENDEERDTDTEQAYVKIHKGGYVTSNKTRKKC